LEQFEIAVARPVIPSNQLLDDIAKNHLMDLKCIRLTEKSFSLAHVGWRHAWTYFTDQTGQSI